MPKAIDPICQMEVDTDQPPGGSSQYRGSIYYFCAPGCKQAFGQDPDKYLPGPSRRASQKTSLFSRIFGRHS